MLQSFRSMSDVFSKRRDLLSAGLDSTQKEIKTIITDTKIKTIITKYSSETEEMVLAGGSRVQKAGYHMVNTVLHNVPGGWQSPFTRRVHAQSAVALWCLDVGSRRHHADIMQTYFDQSVLCLQVYGPRERRGDRCAWRG